MLLLESRCIDQQELLKSPHRSLSNNLEFLSFVGYLNRYMVNIVKSVLKESTTPKKTIRWLDNEN